ncbi:spondin domain-containing protein [Mesorhizobium xinjiangense]|uniref:spondin domain-containing protein n=1 Tax=Mesorhizobium xinjiangense TaxID=2678685 RepID=UPI0012EE0348|nr:spondin domain-containing protein [Mesorhizobium xinjiangense]
MAYGLRDQHVVSLCPAANSPIEMQTYQKDTTVKFQSTSLTKTALFIALPLAAAIAIPSFAQDATPSNGDSKLIMITVENVLTGQPFSPTVVESHTADAPALFKLGDKAGVELVAVAEGGNTAMYALAAAMNKDSTIGDAQLAIYTLPGQKRTFFVRVDEAHPLLDGVWMLGNTNDGFSGFTGVDAFSLTEPMTIDVRGYDAGSENNNEKTGLLGSLGAGNDRDPENGVIAYHTGIRGDADAPKDWNWDVNASVAHVTFTPVN